MLWPPVNQTCTKILLTACEAGRSGIANNTSRAGGDLEASLYSVPVRDTVGQSCGTMGTLGDDLGLCEERGEDSGKLHREDI